MRTSCIIRLCIVGGIALAGSLAMAQQAKETKPAGGQHEKPAVAGKQDKPAAGGQPEMKLPPGWTEADMQACMLAGTPGKQHEMLTKEAGVWQGKQTMWMAPDTEPTRSECTATITSIMDGRFARCEVTGDMPGMGPFNGCGIYGYDNVTQKFVATWIDNCGTGMMSGTGELSADGKVLTWTYSYTCPISKKPTTMREVETTTGAGTKTMEMFSTDPKSGKEFKMLSIEYTKKGNGRS